MSYTLPPDADDWVQAWRAALNDRAAFAEAAAGFDADFVFEIRPDESYDGDSIRFRIDIDDGRCTEVGLLGDGDASYDYALRGPYDAWVAMLHDEIDVSDAVMSGTFDLEGDTMTILGRKDAVAEMLAAARELETEFAYST